MRENTEHMLKYVEALFLKYGAERVSEEGEKLFHLRGTYVLNGIYYRAEADDFEEGTAIVLTASDNPEYARLGLGDNIAGFREDLSEDAVEQEIRYALGIDPYPDDAPPGNSRKQ